MLIYTQIIELPSDKELFDQIYHTYRHAMYRRAYRILRNPQDAEDAVHEAFITVAKNIEKFSDPLCHKTRSYLVTIIESRAIDIYRKKAAHPHAPLEETWGMGREDSYSDGTLAGCILRLPEKQRSVILLKYAQGLTNREIGKLLGMTQANVRKTEQRAKEKLEQYCKEEGLL